MKDDTASLPSQQGVQPSAEPDYTPIVWELMTDEQRYEEYIRVRNLVASSPSAAGCETKEKPL